MAGSLAPSAESEADRQLPIGDEIFLDHIPTYPDRINAAPNNWRLLDRIADELEPPKRKRMRKPRKPTLAAALKEARKAGASVKGATIESGHADGARHRGGEAGGSARIHPGAERGLRAWWVQRRTS
jgi:hypothetical protein